MQTILEKWQALIDDPIAYLEDLNRRTGRGVVGVFPMYYPAELIWAAGAHPWEMWGNAAPVSKAEAHLQSYSCSLVRSNLEALLDGRLELLDGVVFPRKCDSVQNLATIWSHMPDGRFVGYRAQDGHEWFVVAGRHTSPPYPLVGTPAFAPNGRGFAHPVCDNGRWLLVREKNGRDNTFDFVGRPVFAPRSNSVAFAARSAGKWFVVLDGRRLPGEYDAVGTPVFSASGKEVAYRGGPLLIRGMNPEIKSLFDGLDATIVQTGTLNTVNALCTDSRRVSPGCLPRIFPSRRRFTGSCHSQTMLSGSTTAKESPAVSANTTEPSGNSAPNSLVCSPLDIIHTRTRDVSRDTRRCGERGMACPRALSPWRRSQGAMMRWVGTHACLLPGHASRGASSRSAPGGCSAPWRFDRRSNVG